MPAVKPCSFERLDLTEPAFAEPSLLYTLTPRGLGTPYVESLSSYVVRLAEAHAVPVWRLILHVRSQVCSERLSRPSMRYAYPANGLGKGAGILRQSFEAATGHDRLPCQLSREASPNWTSSGLPRRGAQAVWSNGERKEFRYIVPCSGLFA
jgi:hypothetical protein